MNLETRVRLINHLKNIRTRLADPQRWLRYREAETVDDVEVDPTDPQAVAWCLLGAIRAEYGGHEGDDWRLCTGRLTGVAGDMAPNHFDLCSFNDGSDHATVLSLLDRAIVEETSDLLDIVVAVLLVVLVTPADLDELAF